MSSNRVFLTRRNLLLLLSKLDRVKEGEYSTCTLIKADDQHKTYPQTCKVMFVTAVEDEDYYTDRPPGPAFPADERRIRKVE